MAEQNRKEWGNYIKWCNRYYLNVNSGKSLQMYHHLENFYWYLVVENELDLNSTHFEKEDWAFIDGVDLSDSTAYYLKLFNNYLKNKDTNWENEFFGEMKLCQ